MYALSAGAILSLIGPTIVYPAAQMLDSFRCGVFAKSAIPSLKANLNTILVDSLCLLTCQRSIDRLQWSDTGNEVANPTACCQLLMQ